MITIVKKLKFPLNSPNMPQRNVKQNMNESSHYVCAYVLFFFLFYNGVVWLSGFYLYFKLSFNDCNFYEDRNKIEMLFTTDLT